MMSGTHGPTKELETETRTPIEKPLLLRILASERGALASLSASLLAEDTNTTTVDAPVKDGTSETKVEHQKPVTTKKDKTGKKPQQQQPQGKKAAGGGTRPEAVPRLHHLYKAAHVVSGRSGPGGQVGRVLSSHYTGLVLGVAQKSVLRLTPRVKRTICKGCQSLLLPGKVNARLVKQGGAHLQMECRRCSSVKNFPIVKKKR